MGDDTAQPVLGTRRRRVRLFVLLSILILLVAYTGCDLWTGRRLDAEIARLEPKYGNLRVASPAPPSVPAANNRARYVRAAAALVIPPTSYSTSAIWNSWYDRDADVMPPDLRALVGDNHDAIALAMKIVPGTPHSWDSGADTVPLLGMRYLSNVLSLSALLDLEAKRPDDAVRRIVAGLAASSSLRFERRLISQLIRIAVADQQFALIQRLIMQADPSKAALADLAQALAEARETDPSKVGLQGELTEYSSTLTVLESGHRTGAPGFDLAPGYGFLARAGRPFLRMAHARYLDRMDQLLTIQAGPRPKPAFSLPALTWWSPIDRFVNLSFPGLERTIETGDEFLAGLGLAEVAVALRRYKLDHGEYPADLSAVTPVYLDRLPTNPFTGKVPTYERDGAGFTLHAPRRREPWMANRRPTADWKIVK